MNYKDPGVSPRLFGIIRYAFRRQVSDPRGHSLSFASPGALERLGGCCRLPQNLPRNLILISCAPNHLILLATPAGFEPATTRLEGECSIQLSYGAVEPIGLLVDDPVLDHVRTRS